MFFQQFRTGGCLSYVIGCERTCAALVDIHVDDGEMVAVGDLRLSVMHTPGHTQDSMCLVMEDRVLTGDTLLIGATGRTDLPTGDPEQLFDSIFDGLLHLGDDVLVYPAHDYKGRESSTIGRERQENPQLQRRERSAFVALMRELDLDAPAHLTEALRTNRSGGRTVDELISTAREKVPFMSMAEVRRRIDSNLRDLVLLDVRERDAYLAAHVPGAVNVPRGQLELRVNDAFKDPGQRIVVYCELGIISTLAAATLKEMGFDRAVALDGGFKAWRESHFPVTGGDS